jgi:DNA polymerase III delta prime subunit
MNNELLNSMWVEKYRPLKLDDLVLSEKYQQEFRKIIETNNLPNLLFSGPPGGGKTTLARILCSSEGVLSNSKDNLLAVNGSAKKTRGISFVDEVIEPFLKHPPVKDKFKVIFIDEADKLTGDGYDSLRAIIEKYQVAYGRFIFTCNYISRIPTPVQSRFIPYTFSRISKDFVLDYCHKILGAESIEYRDRDINMVINNLYPDVRSIVNALQRNSLGGILQVDEQSIITIEKKIIAFIIQIISFLEKSQDNKLGSPINSIIEVLAEQDIEYRNIYTELFFMEKMPAPAKVVVNKYTNSHQNSLVPHMHFIAMIFDIIKTLREYRMAVTGK